MTSNFEKIGFGGGCHWCTEAVFKALRGVGGVEQGFIMSSPPNETFSEAVLLGFDRDTIPLAALTEVHLRTHASTSNHNFRSKYRSAVYVFNAQQAKEVENTLLALQGDFPSKLVTEVLRFVEFKASDERYHQYYERRVSEQFCTRYIDPKLDLLREKFGKLLQ